MHTQTQLHLPTSPVRILLLHAKSQDDAETRQVADHVSTRLQATGFTGELVTARDAINAYAATVGGVIRGPRWNDWIVHAGVNYSGFVVPFTSVVGRINKSIVELALNQHKSVIYLDAGKKGHRVLGIRTYDEDNWKAGWHLVIGGAST